MNNLSEKKELQYLKIFYSKLKSNVIRYKGLKNKSLLLALLAVKSNVRMRLLNDSYIESYKLPKKEFEELIEKNFIREISEKVNSYVITAQGIWHYEKNEGVLSEKKFWEFLDDKWFNFSEATKPLSDKEKVILLAMLAARTFSQESPIDLKKDNMVLDTWKEILDNAYLFLAKNNIVSDLKPPQLYGKKGNEHPVSHLIRHTDTLPKKTRGIFFAAGKQKYFLDIFSENKLSLEKLAFLFDLLFSKNKDFDLLDDMIEFLRNLSYEKCIYIFDLEKHIFNQPSYDEVIEKTIKTVFLS